MSAGKILLDSMGLLRLKDDGKAIVGDDGDSCCCCACPADMPEMFTISGHAKSTNTFTGDVSCDDDFTGDMPQTAACQYEYSTLNIPCVLAGILGLQLTDSPECGWNLLSELVFPRPTVFKAGIDPTGAYPDLIFNDAGQLYEFTDLVIS